LTKRNCTTRCQVSTCEYLGGVSATPRGAVMVLFRKVGGRKIATYIGGFFVPQVEFDTPKLQIIFIFSILCFMFL
jgi:hypothetical protein